MTDTQPYGDVTMAIHQLLERELGELTLKLTHCNDVWHGELLEAGEVIWRSRGEDTREPVEKAAAAFAAYSKTEVVEL